MLHQLTYCQCADQIAVVKTRERMIQTRTDTIRYQYSSIHNGRYWYLYDTSTPTPCVGVLATCNIRLGRSLKRTQLIGNGWHMQTISNTQTCTLSQFYDWLIRRNVKVTDSWLLLSLPAGGGSVAWWWPRPVLHRLCVTGRLVSGYSLLPPPFPPTLSPIMDHKTARVCAQRAGDGALERPLIIVCNVTHQQLMNLQWCT